MDAGYELPKVKITDICFQHTYYKNQMRITVNIGTTVFTDQGTQSPIEGVEVLVVLDQVDPGGGETWDVSYTDSIGKATFHAERRLKPKDRKPIYVFHVYYLQKPTKDTWLGNKVVYNPFELAQYMEEYC